MSSLITLRSNDGAYEVGIQPSRGANCLYFKHIPSGISALRTYDPDTVEELDNPFLYGTPLLFPPNRIKGGKFTYDGREYALPINEEATGCFLHGTLHETPFEVEQQAEYSDAKHSQLKYHRDYCRKNKVKEPNAQVYS